MYRTIYQQLVEWKQRNDRKPLILRGARQVGKTTILKSFAEKEYENLVYLNFEADPNLKSLFQEDLMPERILKVLALISDQPIHPATTLIFFDEVQECPEALNSLKYFCEFAPEYHICAAGSLLGVKLANSKGFPVGKVNFLDLYPMSFTEFLCAIDEIKLKTFLEDVQSPSPLPEIIHKKFMAHFKTYTFIGGMPEAVANYAQTEDFSAVREIQNAILDAYDVDFVKHAPKTDIMKISEIWHCIPSQLAKENKKFIYSQIKSGARGRHYESALQWLVDAGLIHKIFNTATPKLPLSGYVDVNAFKLYLLDVGLLAAMAQISPKLLLDGDELFAHYNGSFIENYIATSLKPAFRQLHYWTSGGRAELDFIIEHDDHIVPIEVKSGSSRQKKSLRVYIEKYQPTTAVVISPANLKLDGRILNCPLYYTDFLLNMLSQMNS